MNDRELQIAENIKQVRERIAEAALRAGRNPEEITLVAVTKNFPAEDVCAALRCGVTCVGENRVQELVEKYDAAPEANWHIIGHLQTNKVKYIVGKTKLIQSVDSVKLLDEIELRSKNAGVISDVLLQVNTSGEESKFGVLPCELEPLLAHVESLSNVRVKGLMTIAPIHIADVSNTLHFSNTHELYLDIKQRKYNNICMEIMSMGMSGDFEEAIACGSNMVRVGSSIFGKRQYV